MSGIGMPSNRTRAMEMFHKRGLPLDAIAARLDLPATEVRDLVFGKPRKPLKRTTGQRRRQSVSPAGPKQRQKVKGEVCIVSGCHSDECAPAHVIDRSLLPDKDHEPLRVIPLCHTHHREYDEEDRSILEDLEREGKAELAYAVGEFGLLSTLQRVSGTRWVPVTEERTTSP
jgi:hypothetical protein